MRKVLVGILAVTALVVSPTSSLSDTTRIKATGSGGAYDWSPETKHAPKGTRVVWKNPTDAAHKVVAYGGNWSLNQDLPRDGRVKKTFKKTGTFKYRCGIAGHSALAGGECTGMCGSVVVHN